MLCAYTDPGRREVPPCLLICQSVCTHRVCPAVAQIDTAAAMLPSSFNGHPVYQPPDVDSQKVWLLRQPLSLPSILASRFDKSREHGIQHGRKSMKELNFAGAYLLAISYRAFCVATPAWFCCGWGS